MFTNLLFPKTTRRTRPEQVLGLAIYLTVSFAALIASQKPVDPFALCYVMLQASSMWALWRIYSLRSLKLELSLFLTQFVFLIASGYHSFLSLVALLLLSCNTLICLLLFRKKEKLAGYLLVFPLCWALYWTFMNMRF